MKELGPALRDMTALYRELDQLRTGLAGVRYLGCGPRRSLRPHPLRQGTLLSSNLEWTQIDRPRVLKLSVSIESAE